MTQPMDGSAARGGWSRRRFLSRLIQAGGAAAIAPVGSITGCGGSDEPGEPPADKRLPRRPLGQMGFQASVLGLGGVYISCGSEAEGLAILDRAMELGINYIDTAANYGQGESERRIGTWVRRLEAEGRRGEIFLATKTSLRPAEASAGQIEQSLQRLGTHIDLLQVHDLPSLEVWRWVSGPDGALRAIEAARASGRVRHVGLTGHYDPQVLRRALEEYPFESVLCPLGITDRLYRPFVKELLPELQRRGISVVAMKVFASGHLAEVGANLERAIHYVLSLPISTAIVGMASPSQVEQNVAWARTFSAMSEAEMDALAEEMRQLVDVEALWWKNGRPSPRFCRDA